MVLEISMEDVQKFISSVDAPVLHKPVPVERLLGEVGRITGRELEDQTCSTLKAEARQLALEAGEAGKVNSATS